MNDPVNKPVHYNAGGVEAIDAIIAATNEQSEGYLQGNIMKYIWRYRYKNGLEDLQNELQKYIFQYFHFQILKFCLEVFFC